MGLPERERFRRANNIIRPENYEVAYFLGNKYLGRTSIPWPHEYQLCNYAWICKECGDLYARIHVTNCSYPHTWYKAIDRFLCVRHGQGNWDGIFYVQELPELIHYAPYEAMKEMFLIQHPTFYTT